MSRPILVDAFDHHAWATTRLIDACLALSSDQLETHVPGTYGSIIKTVRHLVGSDAWYLFTCTGDRSDLIDEDRLSLADVRGAAETNALRWTRLIDELPDPDAMVEEVDDDDGYRRSAPVGIRFAQALHHGTDHRSQICTALTSLGVEPPSIDVWEYGLAVGRISETYPQS